jgi:RNA polymerase sigma-70 factor, ECF subfamily
VTGTTRSRHQPGVKRRRRPTIAQRPGRDHAQSVAELMLRYAAGDIAAYESLYACVAPRIRREIQSRVHDPRAVEDLTQVVFLRAHAGRHRYVARTQHADSALMAWFFAIARNTVHNYLRKASHERIGWGPDVDEALAGLCDEAADPELALLAVADEEERRMRVQAALRRLPPAHRDVIRLHKLEGMPMAEIAKRLGLHRVTIRVRAHRGYTTMREHAARIELACASRGHGSRKSYGPERSGDGRTLADH